MCLGRTVSLLGWALRRLRRIAAVPGPRITWERHASEVSALRPKPSAWSGTSSEATLSMKRRAMA